MSPEWPCRADTSAYVTAVLLATSDHLVASDALLHGSAASLPAALVVGSNFGILAANIFYFTSRLVDTLWSGEAFFSIYGLLISREFIIFNFIRSSIIRQEIALFLFAHQIKSINYHFFRICNYWFLGLFTGDPTIVFQFIIKLISQGKRKGPFKFSFKLNLY